MGEGAELRRAAASGAGRVSAESQAAAGPGLPEMPARRTRPRTPVSPVGPAGGAECEPLVGRDRSGS